RRHVRQPRDGSGRLLGRPAAPSLVAAPHHLPPVPESVLVTGGTGLLGRHLVAALHAAGDHVRLLVRSESEPPPDGCEVVRADVADEAAVRAAVHSVRAVYHLAAITRKWRPDRAAFARINVDAAVRLTQLAAEASVERIVHVSSFTVFGPSPADGTAID